MYDYSAEMNGMIVFMVALFLIGYENIFDYFVLYLSGALSNVGKYLTHCLHDYYEPFIDMYDLLFC